MKTKRIGPSPGTRLAIGAVVFAAAKMVATKLITRKLTTFIAAQRSYKAAHRNVEAVEAKMEGLQRSVALHDAEQDEAVEALARELAHEGHGRTNPFAAFGAPSPALIKKRSWAVEAKTIHQLVATVQRSKTVSQSARDAAGAAERAAVALEAALPQLDALEVTLRDARHKRETAGQTWDTALAALRRAARVAADDGAPGLYPALFGRLQQAKPARTTPPETAPSETAPPTAAPPGSPKTSPDQ